jgi:hypothetical protein
MNSSFHHILVVRPSLLQQDSLYSASPEVCSADEMSLMTCEMLVDLAASEVHACVHTT